MVSRGGLWAWPKPKGYRSGIGLILGGTVGGIVAILERSGGIGVDRGISDIPNHLSHENC